MSRKDFGTIIEIGDILVSEDVVLEYFACDYAVCKGKCCIIGDSGAPLKEEELEPIEANYDSFKGLMRPEGPGRRGGQGLFRDRPRRRPGDAPGAGQRGMRLLPF